MGSNKPLGRGIITGVAALTALILVKILHTVATPAHFYRVTSMEYWSDKQIRLKWVRVDIGSFMLLRYVYMRRTSPLLRRLVRRVRGA